MSTNGGGAARDAAAARRRRIAERGSERLALITGRVPSIPSSSPLTPPPVVAQPNYSPPSVSLNSDQLPSSDEQTDLPLNTETAGTDVGSDIQPLIPKQEKITETSAEPSFTPTNTRSFPTTLTEPNPPKPTSNKPRRLESQTHLHATLTPSRIRPAITASENIRRNCSVIIALLVLLSYSGFPILGSGVIKGIVLFRPLVLLLLTNLTIVAAPLLLENVERNDRRGSATGEAGFANNIGAALEWGLLMKTGLSALFMDCSVYSVVVICGVSFLQKFGW